MAGAAAAGLPVADEDRNGDPARSRQRGEVEPALLARLLQLVAVVLEPDLHLGRRQAQYAGQMFALGRRQVALLAEAALQLERLRLREQNAPLLLSVSASGRRGASGVAARQRAPVAAVVAGGVRIVIDVVGGRHLDHVSIRAAAGSDVIVVVVVAVVDGTVVGVGGEPARRRRVGTVSAGPDAAVSVVDLAERRQLRKRRPERSCLDAGYEAQHRQAILNNTNVHKLKMRSDNYVAKSVSTVHSVWLYCIIFSTIFLR